MLPGNQTTYILTGGNDLNAKGFAGRLEDEINKHTGHPAILSCFFASPEDVWQAKYAYWGEWLSTNFTQDFTYDYAGESTFLRQIKAADVIYLHGGDTKLLLSSLPKTSELIEHFKGKIVIGSSAGANILATNYWSSTYAVPGRGLGILDINIMVHYGAANHGGRARSSQDWQDEEAAFKKVIGSGEVIHLAEGEVVVRQL